MTTRWGAAQLPNSSTQTRSSDTHVLLIDDDPADRKLVRRMLPERFLLSEAETLGNGINRASTEPIDVVLLDLGLPDSRGFATVEMFQRAHPELPVVVLSGTGTTDSWRGVLARGAQDFLQKSELSGAILARSLRYAKSRARARKHQQVEMRAEALRRIAGEVADEFGTLVDQLVHASERISDLLDDNSCIADELRVIRSAPARSATLLTRLRSITRFEPTPPGGVDLCAVLENVRHTLVRLLPVGVTVSVVNAIDEFLVPIDATSIERIVINLALHAREACPTLGTLKLTCRRGTPADVAHLCDTEAAAVLDVEHAGLGAQVPSMTPTVPSDDEAPTNNATANHALVETRDLLAAAGGELKVAWLHGEGARFIAAFPLISPGASATYMIQRPSAPQAPTPHEPPSDATKTLLLVDDEAALRSILARSLREAGYEVIEAQDGRAALEVMDRSTIDLIITDIAMPRMGGRELAEQVRESNPSLPIVFITGHTGSGAISGAHNEMVLYKPFGRRELLSIVDEVLGQTAPARKQAR